MDRSWDGSTRPDTPQTQVPADTGGLAVYSRSLGLVKGMIYAVVVLVSPTAGRSAFNERQLQDPTAGPVNVVSSDFWNRTLQTWQPEFLAVGSTVVFSI